MHWVPFLGRLCQGTEANAGFAGGAYGAPGFRGVELYMYMASQQHMFCDGGCAYWGARGGGGGVGGG